MPFWIIDSLLGNVEVAETPKGMKLSLAACNSILDFPLIPHSRFVKIPSPWHPVLRHSSTIRIFLHFSTLLIRS